MGRMSREKGARAEREVVRELEAQGLTAKRTAPLQAGVRGSGADVTLDVPGFHLEVKMHAQVRIVEWTRQAAAEASGLDVPVVVWRLCRRGNSTPWHANLPLDDFAALVRRGQL